MIKTIERLISVAIILALMSLKAISSSVACNTVHLIRHVPTSSNKPRKPSLIILECEYDSDNLVVLLPLSNSYASIKLLDENETIISQTIITKDENVICISALSGSIIIRCELDNGEIYNGNIYL